MPDETKLEIVKQLEADEAFSFVIDVEPVVEGGDTFRAVVRFDGSQEIVTETIAAEPAPAYSGAAAAVSQLLGRLNIAAMFVKPN
ncbi:MAG: hypothetical protein QOJ97_2304 [Solirubrobacteraceae bacterium]|jgi:hypothetical protein|nr:hypothetical protein [Solirubrobacteraceae bacterium]